MFGIKVDNELTMLQRMVALLRDLVLGVVLLITCLIVYFGGDSSKLNVLDWTKLVGAAALIVIGPIIVFFSIKLLARFMRILTQAHFYFLYGKHMPKLLYAWLFMKIGRMTRREYVLFWKRRRGPIENFEIVHPRIYQGLVLAVDINNQVDRFTSKWYPYIIAAFSVGIAIAVFRELILRYIP